MKNVEKMTLTVQYKHKNKELQVFVAIITDIKNWISVLYTVSSSLIILGVTKESDLFHNFWPDED